MSGGAPPRLRLTSCSNAKTTARQGPAASSRAQSSNQVQPAASSCGGKQPQRLPPTKAAGCHTKLKSLNCLATGAARILTHMNCSPPRALRGGGRQPGLAAVLRLRRSGSGLVHAASAVGSKASSDAPARLPDCAASFGFAIVCAMCRQTHVPAYVFWDFVAHVIDYPLPPGLARPMA